MENTMNSSSYANPAMIIDTGFRSALRRLKSAGRIRSYNKPVSREFEIAGMMKKLDGGPALLFSSVTDHQIPVLGNLISCKENCEAAFGTDYHGIRDLVSRAFGNPLPPALTTQAPVHENVKLPGEFDLGRDLPVLRHTDGDNGR